jgi:hypothetical protein
MFRSLGPGLLALVAPLRAEDLPIGSRAADDIPKIAPALFHVSDTLPFFDRSISAATLAATRRRLALGFQFCEPSPAFMAATVRATPSGVVGPVDRAPGRFLPALVEQRESAVRSRHAATTLWRNITRRPVEVGAHKLPGSRGLTLK